MGMDFSALRKRMVDSQIRTRDVTDPDVIRAFLSVPRERFVPPGLRSIAYVDEEISLDGVAERPSGRVLMAPMPFAQLVQLADIRPTDLVLDIGSGTGYSSAVIGALAEAVVALEEDPGLAGYAEAALTELGIDNVAVIQGTHTEGHARQAPYDVIVIEGSVEVIPDALVDQVRENGRVAAILRDGPLGRAVLYRKIGGELTGAPVFDASVPALAGFERPEAFVF